MEHRGRPGADPGRLRRVIQGLSAVEESQALGQMVIWANWHLVKLAFGQIII